VSGFLSKLAQIAGVILIGGLLLMAVIASVSRFGKDPMNSHGRGPGWECDSTSGGATSCDKDIAPASTTRDKPKPN
jgi:hypothetical protein